MDVLRILVIVIALAITTSLSSAIPQTDEHKSRVIDHVSIRVIFLPLIYSASVSCISRFIGCFLNRISLGCNIDLHLYIAFGVRYLDLDYKIALYVGMHR